VNILKFDLSIKSL